MSALLGQLERYGCIVDAKTKVASMRPLDSSPLKVNHDKGWDEDTDVNADDPGRGDEQPMWAEKHALTSSLRYCLSTFSVCGGAVLCPTKTARSIHLTARNRHSRYRVYFSLWTRGCIRKLNTIYAGFDFSCCTLLSSHS